MPIIKLFHFAISIDAATCRSSSKGAAASGEYEVLRSFQEL